MPTWVTHRVGSRANITAPTPGLRKTRWYSYIHAYIYTNESANQPVLRPCHGDHFCTKNGPRSETKSRAQRAPQAQKRGPTYCAWESRILLQVTLGAAPNVAEMHEKGGQNRPFGAKSAKNTPKVGENDLLRPVLLAFGTIQTESG